GQQLAIASADSRAIERARRLFEHDDGTLIERYGGDMARNAEEALIAGITGDPNQREALPCRRVERRADLAGARPATGGGWRAGGGGAGAGRASGAVLVGQLLCRRTLLQWDG